MSHLDGEGFGLKIYSASTLLVLYLRLLYLYSTLACFYSTCSTCTLLASTLFGVYPKAPTLLLHFSEHSLKGLKPKP